MRFFSAILHPRSSILAAAISILVCANAFAQTTGARTPLNNAVVQSDINMAGHTFSNVGTTGGLAVTVDQNGTVTNVLPTNYPTGQLEVNGVAVVGGPALPTQTGNSGKFLTTDGTAASWSPIAESAVTNLVADLAGKVPTTTTVNSHPLSGNVTITKSDVGLGNVDNTSDATKNAAVATLTNKTLTSPVINTPTGIVKGDVGLGNVDNTSDATKNAAVATLTNKTLTSPVINTPTGIVKGDVGLVNVDNTSDATKNAAVATLTNKTLTSPVINTPTGIVKGDVGLGNVDNTSDATKNSAAASLTNKKLGSLTSNGFVKTSGGDGTLSVDTGSYPLALTPTAVKTANYTAAANELVLTDTTSGGLTVTLPNAPTDGTRVAIKMIAQGGTNATALALQGSDVFNKTGGSTTGTLTLLNQAIVAQYKASGAIWYVTGDDIPLSQLDLRYQLLAANLTSWGGVTRASGFDTFTAAPSSANLASLITDETGTGALVFANSPTFVTPALGTPASGNASNLTNLIAANLTGSHTLPDGVLSTNVPLLNAANGFTAAQTLTLAPAANTVATGWLLTDTTAASSGNQQYSPAVRWSGQGWKTNATAASQAVDFRAYVVPVQGSANPSAYWTLESSVNGASFGTPLNWTSGGLLQVGGTTSSFTALKNGASAGRLAVRLADDSDYGSVDASQFEVFNGSTRVSLFWYGFGTPKFQMVSGGGYGWSGSSTDPSTLDTMLSRNASAVIELNTGTAGQWASLKLGTRNATNNTVTDGLTIGHQLSTGTAAAGLGEGILFNLDSSTTADRNAGRARVEWTDAADATRTAKFVWSLTNNASALADAMTLTPTALNLPTGSTYQINGTTVLSNNTLGSGVTASSLTSFGSSPALSGTPTAPTAAANTNTTQIATTAFSLAAGGYKQTWTAGSATASQTFTLNGGYKNLRIVITGRADGSGDNADVVMRFNSDTGSNYDWEASGGYASTALATGGRANTTILVAAVPAAAAAANYAGEAEITVPNYAGTTFFKACSSRNFSRRDSTNDEVLIFGGIWKSTSAITSVTLSTDNGSFVTGTTISVVEE